MEKEEEGGRERNGRNEGAKFGRSAVRVPLTTDTAAFRTWIEEGGGGGDGFGQKRISPKMETEKRRGEKKSFVCREGKRKTVMPLVHIRSTFLLSERKMNLNSPFT